MTKKRQLKARPRRLSHLGTDGEPRMVDVSLKPATPREAVARGRITIGPEALALVRSGRIAKGDPLQTARLAGIITADDVITMLRHRH